MPKLSSNTVDDVVTVPPNHPSTLGNSSVTPALFTQQPGRYAFFDVSCVGIDPRLIRAELCGM